MARIVALVHTSPIASRSDWLRPVIVAGCALAIILARTPLPF
ncbi:hypothetical protein [Novosphingobium gossypii]